MTNSNTTRTTFRTRACAVLVTALICGVSEVIAAGLTLEQQSHARHLTASTPWPAPTQSTSRARATMLSSHPLGRQILSIEKQESKNNPATPLVRVYEFDYERQATRLLVFELATQTLRRERLIETVHLPLNDTEIAFAQNLLNANSSLIQRLRGEQIRRGLAPFSSLNELDLKASIHEPVNPEHPCSKQRCALLSLFDASRTVFSTEPVVNLSTITLDTLTK